MTARRFLHKMSIEVLTVHKECSHENETHNQLDIYRFIVPGAGFSSHLTDNPSAGKRDFTHSRQSDRARKIRYQAYPSPRACATIGSEPASGLRDTFSLTIS